MLDTIVGKTRDAAEGILDERNHFMFDIIILEPKLITACIGNVNCDGMVSPLAVIYSDDRSIASSLAWRSSPLCFAFARVKL